MDDRRARCRPRDRCERRVEVQIARIGLDAMLGQHPAPPRHLVLLRAPFRHPRSRRNIRVPKGNETARARSEQDPLARRSLSVHVDCDVGTFESGAERNEGLGVHDAIDTADRKREGLEPGRAGEDALVRRKRPRKRA